MDNVAGAPGKLTQAVVRWNVDALKEPRGFIRIIEFIIAIFAFATTTSSSSSSSFHINCPNATTTETVTFNWGYPFRLDGNEYKYNNCNGTEMAFSLYGDYTAPSQFYVFVGVMAFLYCIGAVILYVCFDDHYRKFDKIPVFDFVATCAFVLMWLISASTWASGVNDVKMYTDPQELSIDIIPDCHNYGCTTEDNGNYASLNVSLIFGFLNMGVWAANLWFLYKETKWYKVQSEQPETSPAETPQRI